MLFCLQTFEAVLTHKVSGPSSSVIFIELEDGRLSWRGTGQMLPKGSKFLACGEVFLNQEFIGFHHETDVAWFDQAIYKAWEPGSLEPNDTFVSFVRE